MDNYSKKVSAIIQATGWSQEVLASKLGVSFVTLNSWAGGKTHPRKSAQDKIDYIYAQTFGRIDISPEWLESIKKEALSKTCTAAKLLKNKEILRSLTTALTYHSNGTEGSTMTERDVEAVIYDDKVLRNRSRNEQQEAINHQAALYFLLDELNSKGQAFEFTPQLIKDTHLRLMNGIISDAGYYRNHGARIHGSYIPLANYLKIPQLVEEWCDNANAETDDKIRLLATTHAAFEKIHPFSDGNGRTGRLLLFILAIKLKLYPPIIKKERRFAYYNYLELAQMHEQFEPLEGLMAEEINSVTELFLNYISHTE